MAEARSRKTSRPSAKASSSRKRPVAAAPPPPPVEETAPPPAVCAVGFCPICMAVTALGEARPELVEHLLLAGREVLLAFRSIIDARLEGAEASPNLERITLS